MAHSQYERVSVFREDTMPELEAPRLTPRSSYSTGLGKLTARSSYSVVLEKPTAKAREPTFNYKPIILRSVPLLLLLALTLALVGAIEYAILQLPHGSINLRRRDETFQAHMEKLDAVQRRSDSISSLQRRQANSSSYAEPTMSIASSAYVGGVSSAPASAYVVGTTAMAASSAYVDGLSTPAASSIDTTAFVQPVVAPTNGDGFPIQLAQTSAYVSEYTTSSEVSAIVAVTVASAYVPGTTTVTRNQFLEPSMSAPVASANPTAYVAPASTVLPSMTTTTAFVSPASTTVPIQDTHKQNGATGTQNNGSTNDDESNFDTQNALSHEGEHDNNVVATRVWGAKRIFLGNYLAICVAVLYRLLWVVLYNAFNLIEPFRQLMDQAGALAETAFFSFYQNQSNLLGPVPALMRRRWALALIGTAYMVVNFGPALASESVYVDTQWDCPNPDTSNTNNPCLPRIQVNVTVLRVMQGLLGFAAIVILFTASLLLFNRTGLPTKPNSIATVASLMRHPRLVADLSEMPVTANAEEMQRLMKDKRYRMGYYTCANGLAGYGIQPFNGYDSDGFVSPFGTFKHQYTPVDGSLPFSTRESSKLRRLQIKDPVLVLFLVGAFGVILAYYLDGSKSGFNNFFNSNTFGPRFILTLAGTVIASMWKSTEQDAIVMAPYKRLWKRPSSPSSTILMTSTSTPISSTVRTLLNRYFLASAITLTTLAAEGLNIVVSGVPYANGQMRIQFLVSTYMSIAILGFMIIVAALVVMMRFQEPEVPRKPTTLGAVMSYLSSSRMLDDFEGLECLDEATRDQRVRLWSKKYEFTETVRRDGKLAWTVDDAFDQPRF